MYFCELKKKRCGGFFGGTLQAQRMKDGVMAECCSAFG